MEQDGVARLYRLHPVTVPIAWPTIGPMIVAALDKTLGEYELDDVYQRIIEEEWQVWVTVVDDMCVGVTVSELVDYPKKRVARLILVTSTDFQLMEDVFPTFETWAREAGATCIEAYWRPGFSRKYSRDHGFKVQYHVGVKTLKREVH